jgi:S-methylmethionine-dependent homocysteine/selenocysteine methylase
MTLSSPARPEPAVARYRHALPQLDGSLFLTDGGLETTLIYHDGLDLPDFASFVLLDSVGGREALERYFASYAEIAVRDRTGLIVETATWRASADWGDRLGYDADDLHRINRAAIAQLEGVRAAYESADTRVVLSGCLGPRGDGYDPSFRMSAAEAERYHAPQIEAFADSAADMIGAITMNYVDEAIGIARAARAAGMPVAISFTVETDGRLPTGQTLASAIDEVDAATDAAPVYYMINCAHPDHFETLLASDEPWVARLRGIRANASTMSHAELDVATELDDGDPHAFGGQYAEMRRLLPRFSIMGGCCGTDHRHIGAISHACRALF